MTIPKWKCHKIVTADKIRGITPDGTLLLECGEEVKPPENFSARKAPSLGDYYVRYDDGYESWSPAAAFEAGYAKVEA